jgi:hypothetical protein
MQTEFDACGARFLHPKKRTELAKRFDVKHAVPCEEFDRLV